MYLLNRCDAAVLVALHRVGCYTPFITWASWRPYLLGARVIVMPDPLWSVGRRVRIWLVVRDKAR